MFQHLRQSSVLKTCLTWLTDEEADIVSEDGCAAVQEVTGQLHHHW